MNDRPQGNLPAPVASMLERKFGQFEMQPHDLHMDTDLISTEDAVRQILSKLSETGERS